MSLSELMKDENFKRNYDKAKSQYEELLKIIKEEEIKLEPTTDNIYQMAIKNGIKPTARYFNITPATVRYHVKKYNNENKEY